MLINPAQPHPGFVLRQNRPSLSNIRRNRQNQLESDISSFLVNYQHEQKAYEEVVNRMISEYTAFEVCILRVENESKILEVKAFQGVSKVKWENRKNEGIKSGEGLVGKVLEGSSPIIIKNISQKIDEFKNKHWIIDNQFQSFGCFPLVYQKKVVGTLSLYTAYEYDFHPSCQEFLKRVGSLIAAFIGKNQEEHKVHELEKYLDRDPNQFIDRNTLKEQFNSIFTDVANSKTETDSSSDASSDLSLVD